VPNATWKDLDPLEIERFRRFVRESGGRGDAALLSLADDELCRALGGFEPNGRAPAIRRVALLLFGREDSLGRLLPTHEVAWQVIEGEKVLENEIHRLPLLRSFETLTEKFRARNRSTEIVDLFRTEIPDFSEEAFREAVANAMTHRDYTALGAIHVQWTEEGLKVSNPGGLPEGVRLDNLLTTAPRPRNPLLADAFKRAGIVERTGRGIDAIYYGQVRYGRPLPRYDATSTSVSLFLPGSAANLDFVRWLVSEGRAGRQWSLPELLVLRACAEASRLSTAMYRLLGNRAAYVRVRSFEPAQQEQMVLQYAREHGQITRREAAELCKISGPQATRVLTRIAQKHPELRLEGEKRGARYVWHGAKPERRRK
jgi:ATP-dependent DNA helicase RecG